MSEELIEVYNVYALYELNADGTRTDRPLLRRELLGRRILPKTSRRKAGLAFQAIASYLFMISMPGRTPQLCGNTHLSKDDFWSKEWGEMPPYWDEDDQEYVYDYYGAE